MRQSLESAAGLLADTSPGSLTDSGMGKFARRLTEAGYTPSSAGAILSRFRSALRWCVGRGLLRPRPGLTLDRNRPRRVVATVAEAERFRMLLDGVERIAAELRSLLDSGEAPRHLGIAASAGIAVEAAVTGDAEVDAAAFLRRAVLHYARHLTAGIAENSALAELRTALTDPTPSEIRADCEAIIAADTPRGRLYRRGIRKEDVECGRLRHTVPECRERIA
jgi:hypothetical protein